MIYEYAVKFIYGKSPGKTEALGFYFTAINVHNPWKEGFKFTKKVAIALPGEKSGMVSQFFDAKLGPDAALEIDAPDVFNHLKILRPGFTTGFVIIQSPYELDVIAVYTAADSKTSLVRAIDIERITARKLE